MSTSSFNFRYNDTFMETEPGKEESEDLRILCIIVMNNLNLYTVGVGGSLDQGIPARDPSLLLATHIAFRILQDRHGIDPGTWWRLLYPHAGTHAHADGANSIMTFWERGENDGEATAHRAITLFARQAHDGRTDPMTRPWERYIIRQQVKPDKPPSHHRFPDVRPLLFHSCCFMLPHMFPRLMDFLALARDSPDNVIFSKLCVLIRKPGDEVLPVPICICKQHTAADLPAQHQQSLTTATTSMEEQAAIQQEYIDTALRTVCMRLKLTFARNPDTLKEHHRFAEATAIACGVAYCARTYDDVNATRSLALALHNLLQLVALLKKMSRNDQYSAVMFLASHVLENIHQLHEDLLLGQADQVHEHWCSHFVFSLLHLSSPMPFLLIADIHVPSSQGLHAAASVLPDAGSADCSPFQGQHHLHQVKRHCTRDNPPASRPRPGHHQAPRAGDSAHHVAHLAQAST
jgi:hypothetical protein